MYVCKQLFCKLYCYITREFLGLKIYHLYLNTNILGDFQICISVPLNSSLQRGDKIKKACVLCNSKQYPPWRCSKYTNTSYKREFLKRNGLCYICFEKGHISSNCTMSYSCTNAVGNIALVYANKNLKTVKQKLMKIMIRKMT